MTDVRPIGPVDPGDWKTFLRHYYLTDFPNTLRLPITFEIDGQVVEAQVHFDLSSQAGFTSFYFQESLDLLSIKSVIEKFFLQLKNGAFDSGTFILPSLQYFKGTITANLTMPSESEYAFPATNRSFSLSRAAFSGRVFVYSEKGLSAEEEQELYDAFPNIGIVAFSKPYVTFMRGNTPPHAFICHDSRDKDKIARPLATFLQQLGVTVWYDEFSLNVGDKLRDRIESGLKSCRRCILILSPHFISNEGWTKTEFDSIFTRELEEKTTLLLPIWAGVTGTQVYHYCLSLKNRVATIWDESDPGSSCTKTYIALKKSLGEIDFIQEVFQFDPQRMKD